MALFKRRVLLEPNAHLNQAVYYLAEDWQTEHDLFSDNDSGYISRYNCELDLLLDFIYILPRMVGSTLHFHQLLLQLWIRR